MKKPLSALAALGTIAHHTYEVRAGVGLVFEPFIGRSRAVAMWTAVLAGWLAMASRDDPRFEAQLAFNSGSAVAGALTHFVVWPWSVRGGVPMLDEAEGLTHEQLPLYNAILWTWLIGAAGSIAFETPRRALPWAALGMATAPGLVASARHHFTWAREQAQRDPERWSPALRA